MIIAQPESITRHRAVRPSDTGPTMGDFDDQWAGFVAACSNLPRNVTYSDACSALGIDPKMFKDVVEVALINWRNATTQSIIHGLTFVSIGTAPVAGQPIFADLMWQTRFLVMCLKNRMMTFSDMDRIYDGTGVAKRAIVIANEYAQKPVGTGIRKLNDILRCLYVYWAVNSAKTVRLPKAIYRGIRAHNLFNHPAMKDVIAASEPKDADYGGRRKAYIDALNAWILDGRLSEVTDGHFLSFTASVPTAEYFAHREGILLRVDPRKVEVITSEVHDADAVGGRDHVSGRSEREYVVRIPRDYAFTADDITIHDVNYLIAANSPLCVRLFDHSDKCATYTMNGVKVTAQYFWRSNTKGGVLYRTTDDWCNMSSREFTKAVGFDPVPTAKNLHTISDFVFTRVRGW